jgi:hypothetical protein
MKPELLGAQASRADATATRSVGGPPLVVGSSDTLFGLSLDKLLGLSLNK